MNYLVPILRPTQKMIYAVLVGIWLAALIGFWSWWLDGGHINGLFGMFLASAMLLWTTCLPGYFFFFAYRAKRPNPQYHTDGPISEIERGVVSYPVVDAHQRMFFAAVVAHAPSEDVRIAIRTLRALVKIRNGYYPKMDIYLASEDSGRKLGQMEQLARFCLRNKITISSRYGQDEYHHEQFPRRTKSKEGNLAFFYDAYVLTREKNPYRYVLQFDVDHAPELGYVSAILHAFDNPEVGYVSAPSICDANKHASFWVMPRAIAEAALHGILQAGYNGGFASMPIGSHYAVRVQAVSSLIHPVRKSFWSWEYYQYVGGLGPELAEDHTTGLAHQANGWKSVHAIDAIAHGDGPESFLDSMVQEQQWSRSLMQVLLKWTTGYFKLGQMSLRIRLQYLFAQMWYPIFAIHMLVGILMPTMALVTKTSWVDVSWLEFLSHSIPLTVACILPIRALSAFGGLRPGKVPVFGLQSVLFQLTRWPFALLGVIEGFVGTVFLNRELSFKVTPKNVKGARILPMRAIMPYILVVVVNLLVAQLVNDPGTARGYYYFAIFNAIVYLLVIAGVITIHARESRRWDDYSPRIIFRPLVTTAVLVSICVGVSFTRLPVGLASVLGMRINAPTTPLVIASDIQQR